MKHATMRLISLLLIPYYINALTPHEQLQKLTIDQKIGQLFMVAAVSDEQMNAEFMKTAPYTMDKKTIEDFITNHEVGGIIWLGTGTPQKQIERTQHYQKLSSVPLLIAQDLEWGLSMRLQADAGTRNVMRFPHAMTLGALTNDDLTYAVGKEIGRQAQHLGVHMNLAPVVDVNNNPRNPIIHDRSFGDDPHTVARKGSAFIRGLRDGGIIACAKHFPGHGNTATDSHHALPFMTQSAEELDTIELVPFKQAIADNVPAIMVAHLEVPALEPQPKVPTSLSYAVVTQLLKQKLGFKGLVMPDGLGMRGITDHYKAGEFEVNAFLAGHDIILCPIDVPTAIKGIKNALAKNQVSQEDLDARVLKILAAKEWALRNNPQAFNPTTTLDQLVTPQAQALQQRVYQDAVTVIRDAAQQIPITAQTPVTYIQYGGEHHCLFEQTLQTQQNVQAKHYISPTASHQTAIDIPSDHTSIITLFSMNKRKHIEDQTTISNYGITQAMQSTITTLHAQGNAVVLIIFGSPYSCALFPTIPTIVVAYEDDPHAQKAAANIVLGTLCARGVAPVASFSACKKS